MKDIERITIGITLTILMAGCATTVKESYSPGGKTSYKITCNNPSSALTDCYQKAGEICKKNGYDIISSHRDAPFANLIAECKD